jgi:hypothetical protein
MQNLRTRYFLILLSIACCLLPVANLVAQAPSGFNYQAVARDPNGTILENRNIKIRLTITNGDAGTLILPGKSKRHH